MTLWTTEIATSIPTVGIDFCYMVTNVLLSVDVMG
jgi:hypothetical protein